MKKYFFVTLTIIFIVSSYIIINFFRKDEHILLNNKDIKQDIIAGGLKNARDFAYNGSDIYIAFKNKLQIIKENGKSYMLLENNSFDIKSLEYSDGSLYFINKSSLMSFNISDGKLTELVKNIPNYGDYGDGRLLVKDKMIYISIGAATNSGVVGEDNGWLNDYPFNCDLSPMDISMNSSKDGKTGAFVPYNTKNVSGQKIPGHFPGNASVITYNIAKGNLSLYSWGIRNVDGMDYDSEGRIIATVGGMEPRGSRPVNGDVDYIYELRDGIWYGWPDFSGGDPINSPRFKGNNGEKIQFLLQKHPSNNPPAPLYQHKSLAALSALAIDRKGILGDKDCIYFYDNKENIIYSMNKKGIVSQRVKLADDLKLASIKFTDKGLILLEQNEGYLVDLGVKTDEVNGNSKVILVYTMGLLLVSAAILIWKIKK